MLSRLEAVYVECWPLVGENVRREAEVLMAGMRRRRLLSTVGKARLPPLKRLLPLMRVVQLAGIVPMASCCCWRGCHRHVTESADSGADNAANGESARRLLLE